MNELIYEIIGGIAYVSDIESFMTTLSDFSKNIILGYTTFI